MGAGSARKTDGGTGCLMETGTSLGLAVWTAVIGRHVREVVFRSVISLWEWKLLFMPGGFDGTVRRALDV